MCVDTQVLAKQLLVLAQAVNKNKVLGGYYAVDLGQGFKRYRLDVGRKGSRWEGWYFLKTGSDYWEQQSMCMVKPDGTFHDKTSDHAKLVWAAIVADPIAAMLAYSSITGVCGVCGRKLEVPTSVAIGIGPICLQKVVGG